MEGVRVLVLFSTVCAALQGCGGKDVSELPKLPELPDPAAQLAVWAEYMSYEEVESMGGFLARNRLTLNLTFTKDVHKWNDFARCVRVMHRHGVPVVIWPQLTNEEGRWPNARNWQVFNPFVREVMDRIEEDNLPIEWLVIDMETSYNKVMRIEEYFRKGDVAEMIELLQAEVDPDLFEEAVTEFQGLVEEAHSRGFKVRLTSVGMILDDLQDGDRALQMAFDIPIVAIEWDEASFQLYRTSYDSLFTNFVPPEGEAFTPFLIYNYGLTIKEFFGEKGAVDLGIVASPSSGFEGFTDPQEMIDDMAAAKAAGFDIGQIDLFALDGIFDAEESDRDRWVNHAAALPQIPAEQQKVLNLRKIAQTIDGQFDEEPE